MPDNTEKNLILYGLMPEEYEHPLDRKALDSLVGTPGLDKMFRFINEHGIELILKTQFTGSNIKVSKEMFPQIYNIFLSVCETIHLKPIPELYIMQDPIINAFTVGSENPIVVLNTKTVECLTEAELRFILGHEVGHIKSQHSLYHWIARFILPYIGDTLGKATFGIGKIFTAPLQLALLSWSRKSELTADRAGLLACQNRTAAITAFMKMAGAPESQYNSLNEEIFIEQAREFKGFDESSWSAAVKLLSIADSTHPWTVMRCSEIDKWIQSGDYQQLLDKRGRIKSLENTTCKNCGSDLFNHARFCSKCGRERA